MKWIGELEFRDLGPGQWVLHTSSGSFALFGPIDAELAGRRVEVSGERVEGASAGMIGAPSVMVETVRPID